MRNYTVRGILPGCYSLSPPPEMKKVVTAWTLVQALEQSGLCAPYICSLDYLPSDWGMSVVGNDTEAT